MVFGCGGWYSGCCGGGGFLASLTLLLCGMCGWWVAGCWLLFDLLVFCWWSWLCVYVVCILVCFGMSFLVFVVCNVVCGLGLGWTLLRAFGLCGGFGILLGVFLVGLPWGGFSGAFVS